MVNEQLRFEQHDAVVADNKSLKIWIMRPSQPKGAVVLASGFGRHMYHSAYLAHYLALNGFAVYRYDSLDHVGLSDGAIESFSMGSGLTSLLAAVAFTCQDSGLNAVGVISNSLTTRIALKAASQSRQIAYVVFGVGVVNLRRTLCKVFEMDVFGDYNSVPEYVRFENHRIAKAGFIPDARTGNWLSLESTIEDLKKMERPVVGLIGETDEWVDSSEVETVMTQGNGGPRKLLRLGNASHEIGRNARIAREFLKILTAEAAQCAGWESHTEIIEPEFEEMVKQGISERRIQRSFSTA